MNRAGAYLPQDNPVDDHANSEDYTIVRQIAEGNDAYILSVLNIHDLEVHYMMRKVYSTLTKLFSYLRHLS